MAKKKTVKKSPSRSTTRKSTSVVAHSEHNVLKIVVTTIVVWGVVMLVLVKILEAVHDHSYLLYR